MNEYRNPAFLGAKFDAITRELKRLRCSCVEPKHGLPGLPAQAWIIIAYTALFLSISLFLYTVRPPHHTGTQYTPKTWVNYEARVGRWLLHERDKTCMRGEDEMDPATWQDLCSHWSDTTDIADEIIHGSW